MTQWTAQATTVYTELKAATALIDSIRETGIKYK